MATQTKTKQALVIEVEDLRARLEQAETALLNYKSGKAETQLREDAQAQSFWRAGNIHSTLLAQVSDAVIAVDNDQRVTYLNPAAEKQYGVAAAEAVGCRLDDLHHFQWLTPEDEATAFAKLRDAGAWRGRNIHVRRDGIALQVESSVSVLTDNAGAPIGMLAVIRDVTRQQEAESLISQNEAHLSLVLDNLFAFVGVMLPDGTLIEANRAPLEAAGILLADVTGKKFWECYWWSYSPEVQAQLRDAVDRANRGEVVRYDVPVRMAGDTRMWIDFQLSPLRDETGCITHLIPSAMDITARKQAETALRESEARLTLALASGRMGAWELDFASGIEHWTPEQEKLFGLPPGQGIYPTKQFFSQVHPEDRERIASEAEHASALGLDFIEDEFRIIRPDGSMAWIDSRSRVHRDAEGRAVRMSGVNMDVTERKQAEEALRESELRFRRLTDANIIGIVTASLDAVLTSNDEFLRTIGCSQADVDAKTIDWQSMTPAEYVALDQKGLAQLMDQGWSDPYEKEFIRKDGTRVPVLVGGALLTREPLTWICFVVDLTERKRIEADLQAANYRFRIAEEAANSYSYSWNLDTGIIERSAGLKQVLGYAPDELATTYEAWAELVHPDDRPPATSTQAIHNLKHDTQDAFGFEYRVRHKNEQYRWLYERGVLVRDARGEVQQVIGQAVDITERKAAEEALRASEARYRELNATLEARVTKRTEELAQSHEQLRELSAYVVRMREEERTRIAREVHDELGGSLTVLKMSLARAARGHEEDAELFKQFQDMRTQSDNIVKMVRRIAYDLRPSILDDFGLIAALEWQAQEWSQHTGIPCRLDSSLVSEKLDVDAERRTAVFRVFQESLTNIARHAHATRVFATLTDDGECLELVVKDDGQGIDPERLKGGKSLGLLGMRERIREVGGNFEIDAAPGRGTAICVRVPLKSSLEIGD